ncbi:response regulator transcription factor [Paenibacillus sp. IB182496]|uniref:Response regulator transcription factor n=1 Tax=Paenibacillus sabuli TaxID=2772509 RepID=A0A927BU11_9BACL|nr:response regulator transcription factor [Paenibacillus sabuli]MBD2845650.1 response regulator transcription factor [Paenibacillus sabuli]
MTAEPRLLVVDDEPGIVGAIAYAFRREGYAVETAQDGEEALAKVAAFRPQVMVLDVMMPGLSGYDVCRRLEQRQGLGIILLTVKDDIVDKVLGLELGADDYMTKPFDVREVVARVKALLRRMERDHQQHEPGELRLGPVTIRPASRSAVAGERELELTPKEFDLLALLAAHPGRVYTREQLLEFVWDMDYAGGTRTVDIHIRRLRQKLGQVGAELLQTVHGVGYRASAAP